MAQSEILDLLPCIKVRRGAPATSSLAKYSKKQSRQSLIRLRLPLPPESFSLRETKIFPIKYVCNRAPTLIYMRVSAASLPLLGVFVRGKKAFWPLKQKERF